MITALLAAAASCAITAAQPVDATSVAALKAAGWKSLSGSDAGTLWRGYKQRSMPAKGWTWTDGVLTHTAGAGGGDIITTDQFGDFEFVCQFRTAAKANSGIIYRLTEKHDAPWMTGPEYQVLEDEGNNLKPDHQHSAGALYDIFGPAESKKLLPAGQWNDARIRLRNGVLQHWLNGHKTVEFVCFDENGKPTPEWIAKIAASKFKGYEGFGVQPRGHVALQDHGDEVSYRNIMVRDLDAPLPGEIRLFNGKDLTGWQAFVPDLAAQGKDQASVWRVENGVLICSGTPAGYIRTTTPYTSYVLRLQWRFNPVTRQAGNSGVLLRVTGPDKVWPKSIEAQLHSGNAGDFWNIDNFTMTTDPARTKGRNTRKSKAAERPVGEWNEYEIIVNKGDVVLKVNGEEVNFAYNCEVIPGFIALQSEGSEIHFRNIRLAPLD
ncbi:MAG: DUF1080 domain-containing protein [Phycisphaeraceae bacterium]|nr:DUF1080 domain-containing protein [Phycisphaeraceae bacterium]